MSAGPPRWTDDWPARPSQRRNGHTAQVVVVVICLALIAGGAVVIATISALNSIGPVERKHPHQIRIASDACPYVSVMHVAATNFQTTFPGITTNVDALDATRWTTTRKEVGATAAVLEQAIFVSVPHFPPRARAYLIATARALHAGRKELARARDPNELVARTLTLYATGQQAFGYASDLVGDQCHVRLAADTPPAFSSDSMGTRRKQQPEA